MAVQEALVEGGNGPACREVQPGQACIYAKPANANYVKTAWEEVTAIVSASSLGPLRTVGQCRKRFNDVRPRGKHKLASCQRDTCSTGGRAPLAKGHVFQWRI